MENKELVSTQWLCKKLNVTRAAVSLWVKEGCPFETNQPRRFYWENVKNWLRNRKRRRGV